MSEYDYVIEVLEEQKETYVNALKNKGLLKMTNAGVKRSKKKITQLESAIKRLKGEG